MLDHPFPRAEVPCPPALNRARGPLAVQSAALAAGTAEAGRASRSSRVLARSLTWPQLSAEKGADGLPGSEPISRAAPRGNLKPCACVCVHAGVTQRPRASEDAGGKCGPGKRKRLHGNEGGRRLRESLPEVTCGRGARDEAMALEAAGGPPEETLSLWKR